MQFESITVEVRNGYVVAASDGAGHVWRARARRPVARLLSHAVVLGAAFAPFVLTAASAHGGVVAGGASARVLVLPAELQADRVREHSPVLPAAAPPAVADAATPAAPAAPAPAAPAAPPPPVRPFAEAAPAAGSGGHFSWGWCTWYVSTRRYVPWMGNAIEWGVNAAAMGFPEGQAPRVGAIMVTRESGYGHVAYVEAVDADGNGWTVSEMNYRGFGVTSTRHIRMGQVPLVVFIY
ncbi:MAG: CHAP domain-containing protein [Candidatus Dormibacteria bacterium]